ncbi:glycosyltransferase involved in cell wall biosynthesis [Sphaerotilus hippei]|uniref:Glycosyltransferase involved in cell wall biosynthesis n=1 Tax=Sphaerotilus hippei TaxID=744406 RepID=A0A318HAG0_9BURK|nr:glycosyltransferase family 4 protein [Sphaerotilus hippei]PXW95565.1 glycosyltransferase involved in cell wall biosynthesis [Sphaerotilus hippei]
MPLIGVSLEPPYDPRSWSGSSKYLFDVLREQGVVPHARQVRLNALETRWCQLTSLAWPRERWRARFNASGTRFSMLSRRARSMVRRERDVEGVLQIGARLNCAAPGLPPVFGYHDGNAALRYRHFDQSQVGPEQRARHLRWEGEVYRSMRGIFVMSGWLASSFINDFGIPSSRVHVVGAGINFPRLPDVPVRSFEAPHFLFVGREFERKGGPGLLEAFAQVRWALPEARLTIVGPDAPPQVLPEAPEGVTFAGFLSKSVPAQAQRLEALFAEATALVLPSVYEPFGISLLEGMAWGLPCIAVDRCAMPEIVQHGRTGLIASAGDAFGLAQAMISLGRDPAMAREMGRFGRERVAAEFTWQRVGERMHEVLRDQYGLCR